MRDVKRINNDFDLLNGDLQVIENAQSVIQSVVERLQSFAFEWFLDDDGLPYFQDITGKETDVDYIRGTILSTITRTPGVASVENLELIFNTDTRRVSVNADITTAYGELETISIDDFNEISTPQLGGSVWLDSLNNPITDTRGSAITDSRGLLLSS